MINTEFLPDKTKNLFQLLQNLSFINDFSLVGGTALSLQLMHRKSEDLELIFDGELLPVKTLKRSIDHNFSGVYKIIKEDKNYQIDYLIQEVKVTFFSTGAIQIPFCVKNYTFPCGQINVAFPHIIAVLKMSSIAQRNTIRDYYDLYYLVKHVLPLHEVFTNTKNLIPHLSAITYTETLIYTDDLEEDSIADHLSPSEIVSKEDIAEFFKKEIREIVNK